LVQGIRSKAGRANCEVTALIKGHGSDTIVWGLSLGVQVLGLVEHIWRGPTTLSLTFIIAVGATATLMVVSRHHLPKGTGTAANSVGILMLSAGYLVLLACGIYKVVQLVM
jgi:hypothetical protein